MSRVPSGGWREVYEWCHAEQPEVSERIEASSME